MKVLAGSRRSHILLPQVGWLRIIGRVAFPLFAYQLAAGYLHTHNLTRYVLRLAIWGLIAQPIYMIAFGVRPWTLNIFATLLLGLLAIWGWDHRRWWAVCLLYTSDAADDLLCVDLGGRRIIKKKKEKTKIYNTASTV